MRILFLGDVLGRTGRDTVAARLPGLRRELRIDLTVVNAENASHGFGLAPDMAKTLFAHVKPEPASSAEPLDPLALENQVCFLGHSHVPITFFQGLNGQPPEVFTESVPHQR